MPRGGRENRRGGRGGGRGGRGGKSGGGNKRQKREDERVNWSAFVKENERFEEYYKAQNLIDESEWPAFIETLKKDLPTTFRVTGSRAHADALNEIIEKQYLPQLQAAHESGLLEGEGNDEEGNNDSTIAAEPPKQLPWYPGLLAWQVDAPKRFVRKSPHYRAFQKFLVGETEIGNISRQEAVSMIPPLLLDIQSHHVCLDMCAAPGSKTAQMLEALNPHTTESTGLLIANDSDAKRCHMLVHQTGRLPSIGLGVTNNDASLFPSIKMKGSNRPLAFDRILADVPCTGDGTMRKNCDIWKGWGVASANMLHNLQLRILLRAMQILKPGGRMVYSTCSFNPVENEAVVAAALTINQGRFRLVPTPQDSVLPNLKRRPGHSQWRVAIQDLQRNLVWMDSFDYYNGFIAGLQNKKGAGKTEEELNEFTAEWRRGYDAGRISTGTFKERNLSATLWAPENTQDMGLEQCLRLVPHDQNTGGFFVCVIERLESATRVAGPQAAAKLQQSLSQATGSPAPSVNLPSAVGSQDATPQPEDVETDDVVEAESGVKRALSPSTEEEAGPSKKLKTEEEVTAVESAEASAAPVKPSNADKEKEKPMTEKEMRRKERQNGGFKEDPFHFLSPTDPEVESCVSYFGLNDKFPRDRLFVRNNTGEAARAIYMGNQALQNMILANDHSKIRLLSAGIRVFVKQDTAGRNEAIACRWRIPGTALEALLPYLDKAKIVNASIQDLRAMLWEMYPFATRLTPELQEQLKDRPQGCIIATIPAGEGAGGSLALPLVVPLWKATNSVSLMIEKKEKSTLSLRTFGEDLPAANPYVKKDKSKSEGAEQSPEEAAMNGAGDEGDNGDDAMSAKAEEDDELQSEAGQANAEEAADLNEQKSNAASIPSAPAVAVAKETALQVEQS